MTKRQIIADPFQEWPDEVAKKQRLRKDMSKARDEIELVKLRRIHYEELYGYPAKKSWPSSVLYEKIGLYSGDWLYMYISLSDTCSYCEQFAGQVHKEKEWDELWGKDGDGKECDCAYRLIEA